MSEPKPAATLSATLLFKKGGASSIGFRPGGLTPPPAEPPPPVVAARPPLRLAIADATPRGPAVRLTFRLDDARHTRMKLALAHLHLSGQGLVLAALDHYLERVVPTLVGEQCACLGRGEGGACCGASRPRPLPT
jgi:hypothetical protein